MNPLVQEALGSILRHALGLLVPFIVTAGIWTPEDATKYIAAASLAILALGWSLYQKYASRSTLVTALASDTRLTEQQAQAKAGQPDAPSVTSPTDEVPR